MQFPRIFLIVSCAVSSLCHADASLPPILNSYPKCDYKVLEPASASVKTIARDDDVETAKQTLLVNTLHQMRQRAAADGADAILLTDVQGTISHSQSVRTIRNAGYEIKYHIEAEFISLCQNDNSLATIYTPYSSSGARQQQIQQPAVATNMKFEISLPTKVSTANNQQIPLAADISLQHGFYGVNIGMTTEQVQTLFGLPDAELTLQQGSTAWIYGQEHQLIFTDNSLVAISQANTILSAEIKKRLAENLRFQQHDWAIDNTFGRRVALAKIQAFYQDRLVALDSQRFTLKNEHSQLILNFASYLSANSSDNQSQLLNVSMVSPRYIADDIKLKLAEPDALRQLKNSLVTLGTAEHQLLGITDVALYNRSKLRNGNQLTVLTSALAISYDEEKTTGLVITNILNDYAIGEIQQQLALVDLPTTRDDFLLRFPEAFDSLNQLTLYSDNSEIKATYNNDDLIDSLHIAWY